eukprot:Opistho-1_new@19779
MQIQINTTAGGTHAHPSSMAVPNFKPGPGRVTGKAGPSSLQFPDVFRTTPCPRTRQPQPVHPAGAGLRRPHRHALHGHPPWLRPVAAAHHPGAGLDARELRLRACDPEPVLGRVRHLCRYGGRPLRRVSRADRRRGALWPGPDRHGPDHHPHDLCPDRRRADRRGPGRHHLRGDLRRDRPPDPGGQAFLGHGRGGGGRLVRPVPHGAGGGLAHQQLRLAGSAAVPGRGGAADRAAGAGPARAGFRGRRAGAARADHRAGAARGLPLPQLPVAHGRLLRLRLPGGVHRRAHAQLPEGQRSVAPGGQLRAGADRPVQRDRHLRGRHAGPAPGQTPHPGLHLFRARRGHLGVPYRAAVADERVRVRQRHGPAVALDHSAHQRGGGADLRRGPHVHAGRLRLLQPPAHVLCVDT